MARSSRWWLVVAGGVVVVGVVVGLLIWIYGQAAWWSMVSQWPLDAEESAAVERCEDPGWVGLLKVLEQDIAVSCSGAWFARSASAHLKPRHRQRARWMRQVVADPLRTHVSVFRSGSALLVSGREEPADLAHRAVRAGVDPTDLLDAVHDGAWPSGAWLPPRWRSRLAARSRSPEDLPEIAWGLRSLAASSSAADQTASEELRAAAWSSLEAEPEIVAEIVSRREASLSVGAYPAELVREVFGGGDACVSDPEGPLCLRWLADQLAAQAAEVAWGEDAAPAAEDVAPSPIDVVLEVRDTARPTVFARDLTRVAAWIREAGASDRREARLRSVLFIESSAEDSVRAGTATVNHVLHRRAGSPWARAALALELGDRAEVDVTVGVIDGSVYVRTGAASWMLRPCVPVANWTAEDGEPPPAWPMRAVLAQLALEESSAALRRGEPVVGRRLALLAGRLDPVGTQGFEGVFEQAVPAATDDVARQAIELVAPSASRDDREGAVEARRAWAERLVQTWSPRVCEE